MLEILKSFFIDWLLLFCCVFVGYEIIFVLPLKRKKKSKIKRKNSDLVEISYLLNKYKLNMEKINYNRLLHMVAFVSSIDISFSVATALIVEGGYLLQLIIAGCLVVPMFLISYYFVFRFYKKKGMILDV